jgi:hypothetical protein
MSFPLAFAAFLAIAMGVAHSVLGERYILMRLFRRADLPKLFGGTEFTARTLRFAWHVTSIAWFGFAALLLQAGGEGPAGSRVLRIVGLTFIASGILPLACTRGRHLSWLVMFAIGGVALWCGR